MSVIVKGMEMPSDCCECRLMDYDLYTGKTWCFPADAILAEDYKSIDFDGRPDWCPMAGVKEPHGRLVDADELWKEMSKYTDNMGAKMPFGDDDSMIHRDSACFMIESADTIIEAEGDE